MAWYYILFFVTFAIFILKTVISFIAGDTDVDFDADGDVDFDVSSMLSFKGILHFLLGFSTYLAAIARFDSEFDSTLPYTFDWLDYMIAFVFGIVFMVGLFYLYKLVMKLNHSSDTQVNISGCKCTVLTNLGNNRYEVLVKTPVGVIKKQVISRDDTELRIGDEYTVGIVNGKYCVGNF